jgi:hypothetical protein
MESNYDSRIFLAQTIYNAIQMNNGISINGSGNCPTSGYMASVYGREVEIVDYLLNKLDVYKYICDQPFPLQDDSYFYGAWTCGGYTYLDISLNFDSEEVALQFAKDNKQVAIFDVVNNKSIYL